MGLTRWLVVVGAAVLFGCGGGDAGPVSRLHGAGETPPAGGGESTPAAPAATPAPVACPTDLPSAVSVATEAASDVRLVDGALVYRSGDHVVRVAKDGSNRSVLYTSPSLVRSFVDRDAVIAIESVPANDPVSTFKIVPLGTSAAAVAREITTTFGPTGTLVFGSDAKTFYAIGDGEKPAIVAIDKSGGDARTLAEVDGVVSFPQVVGASIWFVVDGRVVQRMPVDGSAAPSEVFGTGSRSCALAVGDALAFCSLGSAIEQRALTGQDTKTILEADKSKVPAALGAPLSAGDTVFVRSTPQAAGNPYGEVLRAVRTTGDETLLACGREAIHDVAVDATSIAWAEGQKGVFVAPR